MPIITKCLICGKEVKSSPSRIKKTCSKECANKLLSQQRNMNKTYICPICGKEFKCRPSRERVYCSRKCKTESMKGKGEYRIDLDMNEIKRLYIEERISTLDIADRMGTYKKMIRQRLLDMGVEMRTSGESKSLYFKKNPEKNPNNIKGVKEKQVQAQIELYKDEEYMQKHRDGMVRCKASKTPEELKIWNKKVSDIMINKSSQEKKVILMKQYDTKRKNRTFNCTGIENKYAAQLEEQGIDYIREYIIPEGEKRYRYDFYLPKENMLVEVNGTGTHADPEKYMAEDIIKLGIPGWEIKTASEIWHRDEVKRVYAIKCGYNIKTVWEREL